MPRKYNDQLRPGVIGRSPAVLPANSRSAGQTTRRASSVHCSPAKSRTYGKAGRRLLHTHRSSAPFPPGAVRKHPRSGITQYQVSRNTQGLDFKYVFSWIYNPVSELPFTPCYEQRVCRCTRRARVQRPVGRAGATPALGLAVGDLVASPCHSHRDACDLFAARLVAKKPLAHHIG